MGSVHESGGTNKNEASSKQGPKTHTDPENKFGHQLNEMLEKALGEADPEKAVYDPSADAQQSATDKAKLDTSLRSSEASGLMASGNEKEAQKRGLV